MFSLKKNYHLSRYYKKDHISSEIILEKPSFQNIWRKHILMYFFFFLERSSFLSRLRNNIIFLGKGNIIFPEKTRKSHSSAIFLERSSFLNIWKKKLCFFVQFTFLAFRILITIFRQSLTLFWLMFLNNFYLANDWTSYWTLSCILFYDNMNCYSSFKTRI